jgi:hypothetical protein
LSFRDAPLGAGPESILPIVVMDSGLALRAPRNDGLISIRGTNEICSRRCGVICPSGVLSTGVSTPFCKNISLHPSGIISTNSRHPTPQEGRWPSSRTRGGMRWTRQRFACNGIAGRVERLVSDIRHADERRCCVRRSRVVLTPRRWRQVRGGLSALPGADKTLVRGRRWQKSPVTEESTKETVKTIACGNVGRFRCTRCYSCAFYHYKCTRGCGCSGHPAFPTPSSGGR